MIRGAKSIAEYAIRRWLLDQGFALDCFTLEMHGNEGRLTDSQGETLDLEYDPEIRAVRVNDEDET